MNTKQLDREYDASVKLYNSLKQEKTRLMKLRTEYLKNSVVINFINKKIDQIRHSICSISRFERKAGIGMNSY